MSSNKCFCLVKPWQLFVYHLMSSANSDRFSSSFLIWISFIPFSSLIALARTSSTMLDKEVRMDILVLFLILEAKFQLSTIENDVKCGLVIDGLCYVEVYSLYTYIIERFYHEQIWILSYAFSVSIENTFNVIHHIDWFACVESSLHQWNKSHWSWHMSSVLLN